MLVVSTVFAFELAAQTPATPSGSTNPVIVLEWEGRVEVSPAGSDRWLPAQTNQFLQAGDRLRTDARSRATVRLSDLTTYRMGELSVLQIAPKRNGFQLFRGILYFFHRDKPDEFEIRTPTAYAVIRGTEFNIRVAEDETTTLSLLDGEVEMTNRFGQLTLGTGQSAATAPGQAPAALRLQAINVIQWCLYYPAILDLDELNLPTGEQTALADSLAAYRQGDVQGSLAQYPAGRQPGSDDEKIYYAALLLAVGQVEQADALLKAFAGNQAQTERTAKLAGALRRLVAVVKNQNNAALIPDRGSNSLATEWLAESYFQQASFRLAQALTAARKAVEQSPEFAFGWTRVADLEFSFGRVGPARAALEKSLQLAPQNAQAFALKGFIIAARNNIPEAAGCFDRAIALDGAIGNAWLGRGLCRIRRGDAAAGLQDLQVAATLEPQRAILRSYLGKAFSHGGYYSRASHELRLARRLDPADPTAYLYAALLNQRENRINEATRDLEQSQALNDNRQLYRSRLLLDQDRAVRSANLAAVYQDAGMGDVSFREAARAVNADYANYSAHLFLANSYDALRDPRQVNLRYETPWLSEYLMANLLAPVGAEALSPYITQQEYARFFEQNRLGVSSSTEYLSRGDWIQTGSQFGNYGGSAYAFDAAFRSENGHRPNNDLEQLTLSLKLKQEITPQDSLYLQTIYYTASAGDVNQYFDQAMANPLLRMKETQEPILLAGYHHEWSPGVHTLFLGGRLQDTFKVSNPLQQTLLFGKDNAGNFLAVTPITIEQHYRSELEIYTAELQQIWQQENHSVIAGARYQTGQFDTKNQQTNASFAFPFLFPNAPEDVTSDFHRFNVYGYYHWQVVDPLLLIAGISYDQLRFPENFRFAPLSSGEESDSRVSPKAGLVWTPTRTTVARAGYSQGLGGVSFDQSFQLEPTQIAGFNQAFRSIIPESVVGANADAHFQTAGASLEQKVGRGTYLGLAGEWLQSDVDRRVGVFEFVPFAVTPTQTRERLDFEERSLFFSVNQLLGNEWSLGARYRLSDAKLHDQFPEVPATADMLGGFKADSHVESVLHQLNLFVLYTHPAGFFGQVQSLWNAQSNFGYTPDRPGDDFWQFNILGGYRFAHRHAEVAVGLLNITDQDYRLNPLNLTLELPRERTLLVSLRFFF